MLLAYKVLLDFWHTIFTERWMKYAMEISIFSNTSYFPFTVRLTIVCKAMLIALELDFFLWVEATHMTLGSWTEPH